MKIIERYKLDHIAFWVITTLFYAYLNRGFLPALGLTDYFGDVIIHNILLAVTCYINIYVLFERFFRTNRILKYIVIVVLLLFVYSLLQGYFDNTIKKNASNLSAVAGSLLHKWYYNFSIGFFYVAFTLSLELSKQWYRQTLLLHKIRNEKLTAELQYLKAQLNPHFLFNSLNTIYFQIDQSNPEARESLQQFSELLRYQLYECNEDLISIEKEISYLQSYVELQRSRRNAGYHIDFNVGETVNGFSIAPLLLMPFVENAFKHMSAFTDRHNYVSIDLCRDNDRMLLKVRNSTGTATRLTKGNQGIGLPNVKRRLELLYPGRNKLSMDSDQNEFRVQLELFI